MLVRSEVDNSPFGEIPQGSVDLTTPLIEGEEARKMKKNSPEDCAGRAKYPVWT